MILSKCIVQRHLKWSHVSVFLIKSIVFHKNSFSSAQTNFLKLFAYLYYIASTTTVRRSTRSKPVANPLYSRQVFLIESLNRLKSPKVKQKSETVKKKAGKVLGRIKRSKSMPNYGDPPETPEKTTIFFDGDENSMTKLSDKEIRVPPLDIQQNFGKNLLFD